MSSPNARGGEGFCREQALRHHSNPTTRRLGTPSSQAATKPNGLLLTGHGGVHRELPPPAAGSPSAPTLEENPEADGC